MTDLYIIDGYEIHTLVDLLCALPPTTYYAEKNSPLKAEYANWLPPEDSNYWVQAYIDTASDILIGHNAHLKNKPISYSTDQCTCGIIKYLVEDILQLYEQEGFPREMKITRREVIE